MNWLQKFFEERLAEVFCGNIHCTTCGGDKLWIPLLDAVDAECARRGTSPLAREVTLIAGLRELRPPQRTRCDWGAAVVAILYRIGGWRERGTFDGTWIGELLEHRARVDAALAEKRRRHAQFESPEATRLRREEKQRLRQEAHAEMLRRQRERSIWWHQQQGPHP